MRKRLFSAICATALCLTLLPAGALADGNAVYIENDVDISGGGSFDISGGGTAEYDPETNVLTLEDASLLAIGSRDAAVTASGDLTIELKGKNAIASPDIASGIHVGGELSIRGDGSLTIAVPACGIRAGKGLTIDGGDIEVLSEEDDAVCVEGSLTLDGGSLSVAGKCGVVCDGALSVFELSRGAQFTADCSEAAVKIIRDGFVGVTDVIKLYANDILHDGLVCASVEAGTGDDVVYTIAEAGAELEYSRHVLTGAAGSLTLPSSGYEIADETYAISTDAGEHGQLTAAVSSASRGTEVIVSAVPDEGYMLASIRAVDSNGDDVALKKAAGEPNYSFIMPVCDVTVYATFTEKGDDLAFGDVGADAWYYDAVEYASRTGLISGVSESEFDPDGTLTRAMAATLAWRFEGSPWASGGAGYSDVAVGDWYYEAVCWADGTGIVSGYGDGSFGPGDSITREQLAAILYRYAAAKGVSVAEHSDLTSYGDYSDVSPYALDALSWACAEGLMTGRTDSTIDPQGTATRAEAAAIFMRFDENII